MEPMTKTVDISNLTFSAKQKRKNKQTKLKNTRALFCRVGFGRFAGQCEFYGLLLRSRRVFSSFLNEKRNRLKT